MMTIRYRTWSAALLIIALAAAAEAKRAAARPQVPTEPTKVFAKYDRNANAKLDPEERETIRADWRRYPRGVLKDCDANHDRVLSDEELTAIPATQMVVAKDPPPAQKKRRRK